MYADDTTVCYSDLNNTKVQEVLTEELHQLSSWSSKNGLKMNLRKTQFVFIPEGPGEGSYELGDLGRQPGT